MPNEHHDFQNTGGFGLQALIDLAFKFLESCRIFGISSLQKARHPRHAMDALVGCSVGDLGNCGGCKLYACANESSYSLVAQQLVTLCFDVSSCFAYMMRVYR